MKTSCDKCSTNNKEKLFASGSFLGVLLLVILPKCPICVMAYTGAVALCSGGTAHMLENNWGSYLPLIIALSIFIHILRGSSTFKKNLALPFAVTGLVFIVLTHQLVLGAPFYYGGAVLLFISVWMNSSFLSVINLVKSKYQVWRG